MKRAGKVAPVQWGPHDLGRMYANVVRLRSKLCRSNLPIDHRTRQVMAEDLEALAWIAENYPEVFGSIPPKVRA